MDLNGEKPPADLSTLWEDTNKNYLLKVSVTADRLGAFITIQPISETPLLNAEEITSKIRTAGLAMNADDQNRLKETVIAFNKSHQPVVSKKFLQGIAPGIGENGTIQWGIDISAEKSIQDNEQVDFREKSNIKNVTKDTVILTIVEPTRGAPGVDVYGNNIPGISGAHAIISPGRNVLVSQDGKSFIAGSDGMVIVANNIVNIEELLVIEGDVDFSTGNINFKGTVYIKGNVLDGFRVNAEKGIQIDGSAGSAILESDGDIEISGGIAAKGKGSIKTKGSIKSKYLNQVEVENKSDIIVQTEIVNCRINTLGNIIIRTGAIVGSECIAYGEIEAAVIGSRMHVKTTVASGINFSIRQRLKILNKEYAALLEEFKSTTQRLMPYLQDKEKVKSASEHSTAVLRRDLLEFQEKKARLAAIDKEIKDIQSSGGDSRKRGIKVHRTLFGGVEVQIYEAKKTFTDDLKGPIKIFMDEDKTIKIRPW